MHQPELTIIVVVTIAILVAAADIIVRLILLPARKDKLIRELLDNLVEVDANTESLASPKDGALPAGDLQECLLRHFERSRTSRQILNALAKGEPLSQGDLLSVINRTLADKGRAPLPLNVARRVAINLLHAGLLEVRNGGLRITKLGQSLNLLLQTRKQPVTTG